MFSSFDYWLGCLSSFEARSSYNNLVITSGSIDRRLQTFVYQAFGLYADHVYSLRKERWDLIRRLFCEIKLHTHPQLGSFCSHLLIYLDKEIDLCLTIPHSKIFLSECYQLRDDVVKLSKFRRIDHRNFLPLENVSWSYLTSCSELSLFLSQKYNLVPLNKRSNSVYNDTRIFITKEEKGKNSVCVKMSSFKLQDYFRIEDHISLGLKLLDQHPYIMGFHETGIMRLEGCYVVFFVMPYLGGSDLHSILSDNQTRFSLRKKFEILFKISDALVYFHKTLNRFHGDIKPANILLTDLNHPYLIDYEYSVNVGEPFTCGGSLLWAAPEVFGNETQGTFSDIYSFGLLLDFMLTGSLFYYDPSRYPLGLSPSIFLNRYAPYLKGCNTSFASNVSDLMVSCLQRDLQLRPDIDQVKERLNQLLRFSLNE